MKWMQSLLFLLSLIGGLQASSANAVDPVLWHELVQATIDKGETLYAADVTLRYLGDLAPPDISSSHNANYFGIYGIENGGIFFPGSVSVVDESWVLNSKSQWEIDQWVYAASLEGRLTQVSHGKIVEDLRGRVLETIDFPTGGVSDPGVQGQWIKKIKFWFLKRPH